ncbi:MAG: tRNA (adenosine(37)-N6)-dimethylallyltransferase MiaA [Balneolaceae bacterium]
MNRPRILIAGPTASGKSSLAVALAKELNGEIISADSRQCFRGLDAGTAKPDAEQLAAVPHHNISCLDITKSDTAQQFYDRATAKMDDIEARNKQVIVAGGSTLHLQSLLFPFDDLPESNEANLAQLRQEHDRDGIDVLYLRLKEVDPEYIGKMDGKNVQRIYRALDVWMQTGKPFSSFHQQEQEPDLRYRVFLLHRPRKKLHERINLRCDEMLANGLVEEVKELLADGLDPGAQALQSVGYRQVLAHLDGNLSYEQMVKDMKTATRRYAKRQITWFRKWDFATWLPMHELDTESCVERIKQQVAAECEKG